MTLNLVLAFGITWRAGAEQAKKKKERVRGKHAEAAIRVLGDTKARKKRRQ